MNMINSRKKLLSKIAQEKEVVDYLQIQVKQHKDVLAKVAKDNKLLLILIVLPSLIWGFSKAREKKAGQLFKELVQIGVAAITTYFKSQLLRTIIR